MANPRPRWARPSPTAATASRSSPRSVCAGTTATASRCSSSSTPPGSSGRPQGWPPAIAARRDQPQLAPPGGRDHRSAPAASPRSPHAPRRHPRGPADAPAQRRRPRHRPVQRHIGRPAPGGRRPPPADRERPAGVQPARTRESRPTCFRPPAPPASACSPFRRWPAGCWPGASWATGRCPRTGASTTSYFQPVHGLPGQRRAGTGGPPDRPRPPGHRCPAGAWPGCSASPA